MVRNYIEQTRMTWPLLVDESRELYRAYGILEAGWLDILGPRVWWAYARLMLKGRRPIWPTGDARQRGGNVIVDPKGIVRFHHVATGPADRPAVRTLLDIVRSA